MNIAITITKNFPYILNYFLGISMQILWHKNLKMNRHIRHGTLCRSSFKTSSSAYIAFFESNFILFKKMALKPSFNRFNRLSSAPFHNKFVKNTAYSVRKNHISAENAREIRIPLQFGHIAGISKQSCSYKIKNRWKSYSIFIKQERSGDTWMEVQYCGMFFLHWKTEFWIMYS